MSTVESGKVVLFHYTLTDDDGTVLDSSHTHGDPMPYLHGAQNIVPGLEAKMNGRAIGDKFTADISTEEGYGEHNGMDPQPVPRTEFPADAPLKAGMQLMAQMDDGQGMPVWIAKVEDDTVHIDINHPLAGKVLHFDVEITGIRDATEEEVAHGHPHGPDGAHHH